MTISQDEPEQQPEARPAAEVVPRRPVLAAPRGWQALALVPIVALGVVIWLASKRVLTPADPPTVERVLAALVRGDQAGAEVDAAWIARHPGSVGSSVADALTRIVRNSRPDGSPDDLVRDLSPHVRAENTSATLLAHRACRAAVAGKIARDDHEGALVGYCTAHPLLVRDPDLGKLLAQSADVLVDRCGEDRTCALRQARTIARTVPGLLTRHSLATVQRDVLAQLDIATVDADAATPAERARRLRDFVKRANQIAAAVPDEPTLVAKASAAIDRASRDPANAGLVGAPRASLEEALGAFDPHENQLTAHGLARGERVSIDVDPRGLCAGLRMSFPKAVPELWTPEAFVRLALGYKAKLHVAPQGNGDVAWKEGKTAVAAVWKDGAVRSVTVGEAPRGE